MKRLLIISAILGIVAATSSQSNAQVSVHLNIGTQPAWVPSGYQSVNYYYLPEVQSYYYVPQRQFVYLEGNRWTRSRYLPARYRNYNLNSGRKIVVYGNRPYRNYKQHYATYTHQPNYYRSSYGGLVRGRQHFERENYKNNRGDSHEYRNRGKSNSFYNGHERKHGRH